MYMVELIANVNNAINGFVWGVPMLVLLVGTGILMTFLTKFFQLSHIGHWFKNTVGGIFHDEHVPMVAASAVHSDWNWEMD